MNNNLIKLTNPNKANHLAKLGFSYIKEQINNQDVFTFVANSEILKHLQCNFDKRDFYFENTLRF